MNKDKLKLDLEKWRFNPKHKNPISIESLAKIMGYSPSTLWSVLNKNNIQTAGRKFWFQIDKATGGVIKRDNYYKTGE